MYIWWGLPFPNVINKFCSPLSGVCKNVIKLKDLKMLDSVFRGPGQSIIPYCSGQHRKCVYVCRFASLNMPHLASWVVFLLIDHTNTTSWHNINLGWFFFADHVKSFQYCGGGQERKSEEKKSMLNFFIDLCRTVREQRRHWSPHIWNEGLCLDSDGASQPKTLYVCVCLNAFMRDS